MHWLVIKKGTEYLGTENQEPILEELVSKLEPKRFGTDPALQAIFVCYCYGNTAQTSSCLFCIFMLFTIA